MAAGLSRRRKADDAPYWPGFVDAMAQLLLVITFLLSVFIVAQFLLAREMSGQDSALAKLRAQIAELSQLLSLEESAKAELEATLSALTDDLKLEKGKSADLSALLAAESQKSQGSGSALSGLRTALDKEKALSADALARVELLNQQIAALRRQINELSKILADAETKNRDSEAQIADLGRRLNSALALKVQELNRYRSEFFGKLRKILADRPDILVVGDRFVFQSEVLFGKGDAALNPAGEVELGKMADAILELKGQIPADVNWTLRVDGHTDSDPINSVAFKSNWELSAARSIAVVNFLISKGVPPERLVAAGFGEFQPLDPGFGEDAKSRNRRIEFKLTDR